MITNTTVNTLTTVGIETIAPRPGRVLVYPNPFSEFTTFRFPESSGKINYTLALYDVLGKQVKEIKSITTNEYRLKKEGIKTGLYIYKISSGNEMLGIGKLIVE